MAQNIYDNPEFFSSYIQLPRQVHGLDGAPEWPVIRALLPPLAGKRVLDLGCGFGWAARWMRGEGALSVLGLDVSENMIARARRDTEDPAIEYRIADLETLTLPGAAFDLVHSSLAFHYVEDFSRLARVIHQALRPGGDLIFMIEHPVFMAPAHPAWIGDARKSWPLDSYSREGKRTTHWFVDGVVKYHRMLATTLNTLIDAGFVLHRIAEFVPTPEQIQQMPELAEQLERPLMLIVAAHKAA